MIKNILKRIWGCVTISNSEKEYFLSARTKSDKAGKDWGAYVKAKKKTGYFTSGSLLEQAAYELMERDGWDIETQQFNNFNDDEDNELKLEPKHTLIGQKSVEQSVELVEKENFETAKSLAGHINVENKNNGDEISAVDANTEQTMFIKVENPSDEQLYTYAFCKVFEDMSEVHYEQIEQLSIPFFKSKDDRAIKNKPNILIGNQCIIKTNKNNYKTIPSGIQQYITENVYLDEILKEKVNMDFLEALRP